MNSFDIEAIVLAKTPYRESDLIIRVLAPVGKLGIYCRRTSAIAKRGAHPLEPFDHGIFSIRQRRGNLYEMLSFAPTTSYRGLRSSLERLELAGFLAEIFDAVIPETDGNIELFRADEFDEYFSLLGTGLEALENRGTLRELLIITFEISSGLLTQLGLPPLGEIPSLMNLTRNLNSIENYIGRRLETRKATEDLARSLVTSTRSATAT